MGLRLKGLAALAVLLAASAARAEPSEPEAGIETDADADADAEASFLEARVLEDPLDFGAQARLATCHVRLLRESGDLSHLDRAARAARASLAALPASRNPAGLAALAVVELESHHFAEALSLAKRAHEIDPGNASALATMGDALLELGNTAEATEIYDRLALLGDSPPILARLARVAELNGDRRRAIDLLRRAAHGGAWFRVRLGELHLHAGDLRKAEAQYQAALKDAPEGFLATEHLAELRAAQGRFDEAIALYERLIARTARPELVEALGNVRVARGDSDAATAKASVSARPARRWR